MPALPRVIESPADVAALRARCEAGGGKPVVLVTFKRGGIVPVVNITELTMAYPGVSCVMVASEHIAEVAGIVGAAFAEGSCVVIGPDGPMAPRSRADGDLARAIRADVSGVAKASIAGVPRVVGLEMVPGVSAASTRERAVELAARLLDPRRTFPVVVIGTPPGGGDVWINADEVASDLADMAEVWVLTTGAPSWTFSEHLPLGTEIYGSAARAYPVGKAWLNDRYLSPLHLCPYPSLGASVARQVTRDAMRFARPQRDNLTTSTPLSSRAVSGTVLGIVSERALIGLDGGGTAALWPESLSDDVPADRLFRKGQRLSGRLSPGGMFTLDDAVITPADAVSGWGVGDVVLARVRSVERELCVVELYPDFQVAVEAGDIAASGLDDIRNLVTVGEVVAVKVVETADSDDEWRVSLLDVEPDDIVLPAPSLLAGGPPWIDPAELDFVDEQWGVDAEPLVPEAPVEVEAVVPEAAVAVARDREPVALPPAVVTVVQDASVVADLRAELAATKRQLEQSLQDLAREGRLRRESEEQKRKAVRDRRELEKRLKNAKLSAGDGLESVQFRDDADQWEFWVYIEWAKRTSASEKVERPWQDVAWLLGEGFVDSMASIQGVERSRVALVMCDVLLGRGRIHDEHKLRQGPGGEDPQRVRRDGATGWRVSLQDKTAGARRLHYWKLTDGTIEFAKVGHHDDLTI